MISYWFVDDPDDLKNIDGQIRAGHGILIDEIKLCDVPPNQIKKMFDLEHTRSIRCRNVNGTLLAGVPRILTTNSTKDEFFPPMSAQDRTGVERRHIFEVVKQDIRRHAAVLPCRTPGNASGLDFESALDDFLEKAMLRHRANKARAWCEEMGVASFEEVISEAPLFSKAMCLKKFEQRRFDKAMKQFGSM